MYHIEVAVDPQGNTLNLLYSSFWTHVRDRPLVLIFFHILSKYSNLWTWPESWTAWYTTLKRPSDCPQAQTLHGIPFLCLCCSFMYCTCPCVAWRVDVEMCLANNIFNVACNLLIMLVKAPNLPAGKICIYYIVMQLYILYWPSTYTLTE